MQAIQLATALLNDLFFLTRVGTIKKKQKHFVFVQTFEPSPS
jgi:hypothetical protein